MTLPVYHKGTRPSASLTVVTLTDDAWTPLWGEDPERSFAAVLGGTGIEGDTIYVTDDPDLDPGDPGVAELWGVRGAAYFETRGTNALYARTNLADPLAVRTTTTVQVPKVPAPSGAVGTKDYRIVTRTGGGAVTYIGGLTAGLYAPVLPLEWNRLRATICGDMDLIMIAANYNDPTLVNLLVPTQFASAGPAFPGTLAIEGVDAISLLNLGDVGEQGHAWWIADYSEPLAVTP